MAKISARGAKEVARFETPHDIYVVTSDAKVLYRSRLDNFYRKLCKCDSVATAMEYAGKKAGTVDRQVK